MFYKPLFLLYYLLFLVSYKKSKNLKINTHYLTLGYLSLYVPAESIPGRVAIGMTTILTLTAMFSGIRHAVPKVSYISYIDIWMVMCLIYVNFFMFEFVLVAYLRSIKRETLSKLVLCLGYLKLGGVVKFSFRGFK